MNPRLDDRQDEVRLYENALSQAGEVCSLHPGRTDLLISALSRCGLPVGSRIFEVGCGCGSAVKKLDQQGYKAIGIDLSALLLGEARRSLPEQRFIQANAACMPLANGVVDGILMECSLSAIADIPGSLAEFNRLLEKNGVLILTDLYVRDPSDLEKFQMMFPSSCLSRAFIKEDLGAMLKANGFTITLWEDHSEELKRFSGQEVLEKFVSTESSFDSLDLLLSIARAKPGYFLCVAEKNF